MALRGETIVFNSYLATYGGPLRRAALALASFAWGQHGVCGERSCDAGTVDIGTARPMRLYDPDAATGIERWVANLDRSSGGNGFVSTPRVAEGIVVRRTREFSRPLKGMIAAFCARKGP